MNHVRKNIAHSCWFLVAVIAFSACVAQTDPGAPGANVLGTWKYTGRQSMPTDAELTGSLTFTGQTGVQISGVLDVIETDARGVPRRLAAALLGRTVDSTTFDFEVNMGTSTRRHVGKLVRDSINGTWIEQPSSGGAPTASGTFRSALVK